MHTVEIRDTEQLCISALKDNTQDTDCAELSEVAPIKVKIQRAHSAGDPNQHVSGMQTDIWSSFLCKGTILGATDRHSAPL